MPSSIRLIIPYSFRKRFFIHSFRKRCVIASQRKNRRLTQFLPVGLPTFGYWLAANPKRRYRENSDWLLTKGCAAGLAWKAFYPRGRRWAAAWLERKNATRGSSSPVARSENATCTAQHRYFAGFYGPQPFAMMNDIHQNPPVRLYLTVYWDIGNSNLTFTKSSQSGVQKLGQDVSVKGESPTD